MGSSPGDQQKTKKRVFSEKGDVRNRGGTLWAGKAGAVIAVKSRNAKSTAGMYRLDDRE